MMRDMSRKSAFDLVPENVPVMLRALGARLRAARLRRRLRQEDVAAKLGFSRDTINAVEHGSMTTSVGAYLSVLWVYGLQREVDLLADPGLDREGAALTFDVGEKRVKVRKGHAV
jgi:transcriptional regulator with XRE-family HTH domain